MKTLALCLLLLSACAAPGYDYAAEGARIRQAQEGRTKKGNPNFSLECGMKPIPPVGCHIERCVNGQWERVCP